MKKSKRELICETWYMNIAKVDEIYVMYRSNEGEARTCYGSCCYDENYPEYYNTTAELERLKVNSERNITGTSIDEVVSKLCDTCTIVNNSNFSAYEFYEKDYIREPFKKIAIECAKYMSDEVKLKLIETFEYNQTDDCFFTLNY